MKKIIATAVAAAFVSPAAFAEITVGGELEYVYVMESTADDTMSTNDNLIFVQSTTELPNGMTVSGTFNLVGDADTTLDNQGTNITLSGDFGSLGIGDVSSAQDATGDWTDIGPTGGGFGADGVDHVLGLTLPSMSGVTLRASYAPEGANDVTTEASTAIVSGSSVSLTYSGAVDVYVATEEASATNLVNTAYGVRGTFGGIYLAFEQATEEQTSGNDNEVSGFAVRYNMGDLEFGAEKQEEKISGAAATTDLTMVYAQYHLGPVDLYVSSLGTDVSSDNDETRVGIEYNF